MPLPENIADVERMPNGSPAKGLARFPLSEVTFIAYDDQGQEIPLLEQTSNANTTINAPGINPLAVARVAIELVDYSLLDVPTVIVEYYLFKDGSHFTEE